MKAINPEDRKHEQRTDVNDEAQAGMTETGAKGTRRAGSSRRGADTGRTNQTTDGVDPDAVKPREPAPGFDPESADHTDPDPAQNQASGPKAAGSSRPDAAQNQAPVAARTRLFEEREAEQFRTQWREVQAGFVDEPRAAVREAETLVSQMLESLTNQLHEQKRSLASGSDSNDTEQLRVALQRYRSLVDQMLQV